MTTTFEQVFRHLLNDIQLSTGLLLTEDQVNTLVNKYVLEKDAVVDTSDDDSDDGCCGEPLGHCECGDCEHMINNKSYC
jgi:hypothetical protein